MRGLKMAATAAALGLAAMLAAGCGDMFGGGDDGDDTTEASAAADATTDASTDAPEAPAEEAAVPVWVGNWVESAPDQGSMEIRADGTVQTNEASLPVGTWEEGADGSLVITFAGRNTVQVRGRMDGNDLILTTPAGQDGRFTRTGSGSGGSSSAPASSGKPG